jgi:hypothetical protein
MEGNMVSGMRSLNWVKKYVKYKSLLSFKGADLGTLGLVLEQI